MRTTIRSLSGLASAAIVTAIFVFGVQTPSQGQRAVAKHVPFRAGFALIITGGQTVASHDFLVVPTGKRFVLEGASAYALAPGQQFLARVLVNEVGEGVQQVHLPMRHQGTWANSGDHYVATEQIRLVLNAGEQLTVQFVRDLPAGSAFAEATVFGYFEDEP